MAIIASTLARIKQDPLVCLGGAERVNRLFAEAGHCWRKTAWDPAATLGMFILQVLHQNTAISGLRFLADRDVKESTYCEARQRLPAAGVARVVESVCGDYRNYSQDAASLPGHRVFLADATSATAPDKSALRSPWPQPSAQKLGRGFPAIKLLGLLDLATGMIVQLTLMAMNVHEMSQAAALGAMLKAGDVPLADRGFCSFAHVAMLLKMSVHAVFRMHQRQIVDFTPNRPHRRRRGKSAPRKTPTSRFVRRLGREDQLVQWAKPRKPHWMSEADYAAMPQWLTVREPRYHVVRRGSRARLVVIATTLLDPVLYPKQRIATLYGLRWEIEESQPHYPSSASFYQLAA